MVKMTIKQSVVALIRIGCPSSRDCKEHFYIFYKVISQKRNQVLVEYNINNICQDDAHLLNQLCYLCTVF